MECRTSHFRCGVNTVLEEHNSVTTERSTAMMCVIAPDIVVPHIGVVAPIAPIKFDDRERIGRPSRRQLVGGLNLLHFMVLTFPHFPGEWSFQQKALPRFRRD